MTLQFLQTANDRLGAVFDGALSPREENIRDWAFSGTSLSRMGSKLELAWGLPTSPQGNCNRAGSLPAKEGSSELLFSRPRGAGAGPHRTFGTESRSLR